MADKRTRRSQDDMFALRAAIADIVARNRPLTVRHLFYLMVSAGLIEKTEAEYKNVTIRLAGVMREDWLEYQQRDGWTDELVDLAQACPGYDDIPEGDLDLRKALPDSPQKRAFFAAWDNRPAVIPFGRNDIVDAGRWIRQPRTHAGAEAALRDTAQFYRTDLWANQDVYVAFFCEKDAIADLVYRETAQWDVPLAVMRGDSSKTFLWECAKAIEAEGKPATLYFLGDYDVKGQQIIQSAVERIRRYAPEAEIEHEILAITEDQIEQYSLPTRPEKSDATRDAVEIDALPPAILRGLINDAIERHVPRQALDVLRAAESSEREILGRIASHYPKVREFLSTMADKE